MEEFRNFYHERITAVLTPEQKAKADEWDTAGCSTEKIPQTLRRNSSTPRDSKKPVPWAFFVSETCHKALQDERTGISTHVYTDTLPKNIS
jgi:hypothetical protein